MVRVSDRGPGIEREEQDRIFERFVRGRHAGETRARGSGIGLALVKHIAESHGGKVGVLSPVTETGRGSAFEISIPAIAEARSEPEGSGLGEMPPGRPA
jgi:two-component system phosphate regulon sensor histidine kinase PhoR